jgi:D-psicose/D-tagatose/L-ribulose 3-epimerase
VTGGQRNGLQGLAMMNWMRLEPIEASIERLARHGFDAIELASEPGRTDPERTRSLLEDNGLACWGTATMMRNGRDLGHEDDAVRARTLAYVKDTITLASRLGGKIVTITPAVGKLAPAENMEKDRRRTVDALRDAHDHARGLGVRLGFEALNRYETSLVNRCEQALALADEVGEGFGVVLDLFHMNIEEADWIDAIRAAGPRLVDLHAADNNRRPPGKGSLDWPRVFRELAAIHYGGCITVEFVPDRPLGESEYDRWTEESIAFLRRYLDVGAGREKETSR